MVLVDEGLLSLYNRIYQGPTNIDTPGHIYVARE